MSRKKKPVFRATCRYCRFYRSGHICTLFHKKVIGSSPACNSFKMANAFWCDKHGYQVYTAACFKRQDRNYPGCVHCWQGKGIREVLHQRQLSLLDQRFPARSLSYQEKRVDS